MQHFRVDFLNLGEYIILCILFEIEIADVLNVRQVCRVNVLRFHLETNLLIKQTCSFLLQVTQAKLIWMNLMPNKKTVPPSHTKPLSEMTGHEMEILTRRLARMEYNWDNRKLGLKNIIRFDQPQEVRWLRLVCGRWLLVASSDSYVSRLCCFDVGRFSISTKPIAECFFAGPVNTAHAELQSDGLVIAVGVEFP